MLKNARPLVILWTAIFLMCALVIALMMLLHTGPPVPTPEIESWFSGESRAQAKDSGLFAEVLFDSLVWCSGLVLVGGLVTYHVLRTFPKKDTST